MNEQKIYEIWDPGDHPGWYTYSITRNTPLFDSWILFHRTVVSWVNSNIECSYRHARWNIHENYSVFKFRYERDYLRFVLRWS